MIDKQTIAMLESYGELQFSRQKIAIIMDDPAITRALTEKHDPKKARKADPDDELIRKAVMRGQLKSEAELRKSIKTQALQGVSNAQKIMLDLVDERKMEEQEE